MDLGLFKDIENDKESNDTEDFLHELDNFIKNNMSEISEESKEEENIEINNEKLEYRKEGHLYLVTEDRNDKIYLWDYTQKAEDEIEEDLPEDLRGIATEGAMLKFENGKYILYSPYGYDIVENEEE